MGKRPNECEALDHLGSSWLPARAKIARSEETKIAHSVDIGSPPLCCRPHPIFRGMQLRAHLCDPSQTTSRKHAPPAALLTINTRTPAPAVTPGAGDRRPAETWNIADKKPAGGVGGCTAVPARAHVVQQQARQAVQTSLPASAHLHRPSVGGIAMTRVDPASMPAAGLCRARDT